MAELNDILNSFRTIGLNEIDGVKLLDRMDMKFSFHISRVEDLLQYVKTDYYLLDVDGGRLNKYKNIYFDTEDLLFYRQHHNGKANRHKVRVRNYADTGLTYFEIKTKGNTGLTTKSRIKRQFFNDILEIKEKQLLAEKTGFQAEEIKPSLFIEFSRITLIDKALRERVTFDSFLSFSNDKGEVSLPGLVVAEIKQSRQQHSGMMAAMRRHHIQDVSLSKYCLGMISLNKDIKYNRFKPKLIQLNKINHEKTSGIAIKAIVKIARHTVQIVPIIMASVILCLRISQVARFLL